VTVTWHVVDLRRAVVEIADLERGMTDALAVSVQQVVGRSSARELRDDEGRALDRLLQETLDARAAVWGVRVQGAGFTTVTPAGASLRLAQLASKVEASRAAWEQLCDAGVSPRAALGILGTRLRLRS